MTQRVKGMVGLFVVGSLMFSSTAAAASATGSPQPNPWGVLSAMSGGAPAAAMCGAAVAAAAAQNPTGCVLPAIDSPPPVAQAAPAPPAPVPPIAAPSGAFAINPILLGLLALAAGVGIYFAVRHHGNSPT